MTASAKPSEVQNGVHKGANRSQDASPKRKPVQYRMADPPDGGWGWVVVFSSFMIHVIVDGVTYTFGIFYMEFLKHFKESKGYTSWVASIMVGTTFCVGPIASGLTNKFGCRAVTILGSILASLGLLLSTLAPNVAFLFFSIGLCTGTGFGLIYLPAIVCVTCYFEKRRAFATGIAVCGSGIGTFALAPLTEWLVDKLGWEGAMLVVAGMVLNCCVFGALFRPLKKVPVYAEDTIASLNSDGIETTMTNGLRKGSLPNGTVGQNGEVRYPGDLKSGDLVEHSQSTAAINLQIRRNSSLSHVRMSQSMTLHADGLPSSRRSSTISLGPLSRKDIFYSGNIIPAPDYKLDPNIYMSTTSVKSENQEVDKRISKKIYNFLCSTEMREAFVEMMDFRLMLDVIFLMFGFSNFFTNIGFNVPFVYTKHRAVGMGIADETYASYLLSIIGIANTIGRVLLGYLSDIKCINRLWLYNASLTLCGIATALSSFCTDYNSMALYAAVFGATAGAYVSLTSVILVDLLGLEKLTNAFGLLLVFEGIACLIGPPITGWLHDYTGTYDPGFCVSGVMIAISGLMLFAVPFIQRLRAKSQQQRNNEVAMEIVVESEEPTTKEP